MNKKFLDYCEELANDVKKVYEEPVSISEAEKLATKFLGAQFTVATEMRTADLDARMKKTGVKAVKAAIYMEEATKGEKKPSDVLLQNLVDLNKIVQDEQNDLDQAEVYRDSVKTYLDIFREAHVFFRQISKAGFSG